jgi:hypothetical protein
MRQDQTSWVKGHAAGEQGLPPVCPQGLDPLSFSSGYGEGKAQSKPDEHDQPVPGEPRTRFAHPCKAESMFCGRRADARMIRTRSR